MDSEGVSEDKEAVEDADAEDDEEEDSESEVD